MGRTKANIKSPDNKLNESQTRFAELYASGPMRGNGVHCYSEAYGIDLTEKGGYATCRANSSRLLTNADILDHVRSLYETADLNNTIVDNELAFVIKQNADFGSKVAAIREYNQLRSRIKQKIEVASRTFTVQLTDE